MNGTMKAEANRTPSQLDQAIALVEEYTTQCTQVESESHQSDTGKLVASITILKLLKALKETQ